MNGKTARAWGARTEKPKPGSLSRVLRTLKPAIGLVPGSLLAKPLSVETLLASTGVRGRAVTTTDVPTANNVNAAATKNVLASIDRMALLLRPNA